MRARSSSASECPLSPESVRAQLAGILRSQLFSNAPSLIRLLRHVVEHTLEGNADELKEYSLGVEVFDRGESFDPRTDTIVRVQARMLRRKLKEYYDAEGRVDPIVIQLPKGHYVVTLRAASSRPHDSTLHLVQTLEAHRGRIEGAPSQMASSRHTCSAGPTHAFDWARARAGGREKALDKRERTVDDPHGCGWERQDPAWTASGL